MGKLDLVKFIDGKTLQTIAKQFGGFLFKNSPHILTGLGVAGIGLTAISAMRDRDKANKVMDQEKNNQRMEWSRQNGKDIKSAPEPKFTVIEVVKKTWKCYLPTMTTAFTTSVCVLSANTINQRRIAALSGLYTLADTALREYQDKVKETVGERKEEKIRGEIDQDHLDKHPVDEKSVIITGDGKVLCFESLSGRYFESSIEHIIHIQNEFNRSLILENYLTLNELYDMLHLEHTELGRNLGWTANVGLVEITYDSHLAKNNVPCVVLNFKILPHNL